MILNMKNDIAPRDIVEKAVMAAYMNALSKLYSDGQLAAYMFVQGMMFERTREIPKTFIDLLDDENEN